MQLLLRPLRGTLLPKAGSSGAYGGEEASAFSRLPTRAAVYESMRDGFSCSWTFVGSGCLEKRCPRGLFHLLPPPRWPSLWFYKCATGSGAVSSVIGLAARNDLRWNGGLRLTLCDSTGSTCGPASKSFQRLARTGALGVRSADTE